MYVCIWLCATAPWGYFTYMFVDAEMAEMVKTLVLYARRLGSDFESHGYKQNSSLSYNPL